MSEEMLTRRRQWLQCFPEGTIEFNLVTRILVVGMLGSLAVLPESQHRLVLTGLVGVLWIDYLLILWWVVQLGTDLEMIIDRPGQSAPQSRRRDLVYAFWASLPTLPALLILAPWSELIIREEASRITLMRILFPALAVCFIVTLLVAMCVLNRLRLAAMGWILLWLIPVFHLLALHRIIKAIQARIRNHRLDTGLGTDERYVMGGSLITGDIIWLLSLVPWLVLVMKATQDSAFTISTGGKALIILGTVLVAVLSAFELSLMERLQRQHLGLINRKSQT